MIWEHIFGFVADIVGWLSVMLPTTGCAEVEAFTGFDIGYINNYVSIPLVATVFAIFVGYELAMFGFRLAVGIYKLLPLSGG